MKKNADKLLKKTKEQFDSLLKKSKRVVITSHINPDSDSISSVLVTYNYIKQKFPKLPVYIYYTGDYLKSWEYFPSYKKVKYVEDIADKLKSNDTLILVDVQDLDRVSFKPEDIDKLNLISICFDHHYGKTTHNWDLLLTRPHISYTSNAHLLYDLLYKDNKEVSLNKEMSELVYTGMFTDTGGFRFLNGSKDAITLKVATDLLEQADIYPDKILSIVYKNSLSSLHILSNLLQRLHIEESFGDWPKFAFSYLTKEDARGYDEREVSAATFLFKGFLKTLDDCVWGFYVRPFKGLGWRVSFRSYPSGINVGAAARLVGGNGHDLASGALIQKPELQEPQEVLDYVKSLLLKGKPIKV